MVVDQKTKVTNERKSSDGSQNTFDGSDIVGEKTTCEYVEEVIFKEEIKTEHYPPILESAPFPALGSLEEIAHTLSRVKSTQTQKSENSNVIITDGPDIFKQEPYHTEGFRNPGWLAVISSFLVNFFVFGTCFSWGIYQKIYFSNIYAGQTSLLKIAFVGTSASALLLALGLVITPIIQKIGFRGTMVIGTIFSPLALILASFATELWHVYLSQGILFGIASAFVFSSSVTLPAQWFTGRRAFATGISVSGSGVGGVCLSPMIQKLIGTVGFRNALRIQGAFGFGILCIATLLAVSRYRPPPSLAGGLYDSSLMTPRFMLLLAFSFFVPFGYVAPFFLAPSYCDYLGLDASTGANMISVMSATNAICRIALGYLADRMGRFNTMFSCTFLAGIFTMLIWEFSDTYGKFVTYCVLYGFTAGGFVSLLPVTCADIVGVENIQRGLGMAYMTTMVGSLVGTPIIGLLQSTYGWTSAIQFAGATSVISALFMLVLRMVISKGKLVAKV